MLRNATFATPPIASHPRGDSPWPARVVVAIQLTVWFTVGALLLHMGIVSLTNDDAPVIKPTAGYRSNRSDTTESSELESENNQTTSTVPTTTKKTLRMKTEGKGKEYKPSSVLMVTVGTTMLIVGPIVLIMRHIETRRQERRFTKVRVDPPPPYEEVAEEAPRYSSLFQIGENGEIVLVNSHTNDGDNSETQPLQERDRASRRYVVAHGTKNETILTLRPQHD